MPERIAIHILIEDFDLDDLKQLKQDIEELLDAYDRKTIEIATIPAPPMPS